MNKICLTAILILCIITFNAGLTGYASTAVMPNQPNGSPVGDNNKAIDYDQYVKKVWVVEDGGDHHTNYYQSFHISQIANGEISGELSYINLCVPTPNYWDRSAGQFTGTVYKNTADCQFSLKTGDTGNIKLVFEPNNRIKATFTYNSKSQKLKDTISHLRDIGSPSVTLHLDGAYQFKPYNLNDINKFRPFIDQSFIVDLNSWGSVRFISGQIDGKYHTLTNCFLTNEDKDILFDFGMPFPYGVYFMAVSFQDVNKDGLKDIIIIADCGGPRAYVFLQQPNGLFVSINNQLAQEINDSGHNKDINTITDYLSEKLEAL